MGARLTVGLLVAMLAAGCATQERYLVNRAAWARVWQPVAPGEPRVRATLGPRWVVPARGEGEPEGAPLHLLLLDALPAEGPPPGDALWLPATTHVANDEMTAGAITLGAGAVMGVAAAALLLNSGCNEQVPAGNCPIAEGNGILLALGAGGAALASVILFAAGTAAHPEEVKPSELRERMVLPPTLDPSVPLPAARLPQARQLQLAFHF